MLTAVVAMTALMWSADLFAQTRAVRLTRYQGDALSGVSVASGFKVELSQGTATSAIVEVNEELEKYLIFENRNGIVTLYFRSDAQNELSRLRKRGTLHLVAHVVAERITAVKSSSGSRVCINTDVDENDFSLTVSSGSSVKASDVRANIVKFNVASGAAAEVGNVDASRTDVVVSSAGRFRSGDVNSGRLQINIASGSSASIEKLVSRYVEMVASSSSRISISSGTAEECTINGASGSRISCESLEAGKAKVVLASGSGSTLSVKDTLDISVSSAAVFTYYGIPAIVGNNVASGGRVSQHSAR